MYDFEGRDAQIGSGGGGLTGILGGLLGGMLGGNMGEGGGKSGNWMWFGLIIFAIIFIIALIFIALFARGDRKHDNNLAELVAASNLSLGNGKKGDYYDHDHIEIKSMIEHKEDRAVARDTQKEIAHQGQTFMQLGFGLSGQIHEVQKEELRNFAKLENQMGVLTQGIMTLLQKENNKDIAREVAAQMFHPSWTGKCA